MAAVTVVAASIRAVAHDPEDVLTFDAASGYTPVLGDVVALSGADEVDEADATDANGLTVPMGIVGAIQAVRTNAGAAGYRVTVYRDALVEGFTGMTAKDILYTSTTAGGIEDADPTTTGVTGYAIGQAISATQAVFRFPSFL